MKYTKKVGEIETIFEGTADEIIELQNKMELGQQGTTNYATNVTTNGNENASATV